MAYSASMVSHCASDLLGAIKENFVLDATSESNLRWAPHINLPRAKGGQRAGSMQHTGHWTVGVLRYSLYCRHVVWMLHNDSLLPEGYEVIHADGDRLNLDPSNLSLVSAGDIARGAAQIAKIAPYRRGGKCPFPRDFRVVTSDWGYHTLELQLHKDWVPFHIAHDRVSATGVALAVMILLKVLPNTLALRLSREQWADVQKKLDKFWKPRDLTQEEALWAKDMHTKSISEMRNALAEQQFGAAAVDPSALAKPVPQPTEPKPPAAPRASAGRPRIVTQVRIPAAVKPAANAEDPGAIDAGIDALFGGGQ